MSAGGAKVLPVDTVSIIYPRRWLLTRFAPRVLPVSVGLYLLRCLSAHSFTAAGTLSWLIGLLAIIAVGILLLAAQRTELTPEGLRSGVRPFARWHPWSEVVSVYEVTGRRGARVVKFRLRSGKEKAMAAVLEQSGYALPDYPEHRDLVLAYWARVRGRVSGRPAAGTVVRAAEGAGAADATAPRTSEPA